MDSVHWEGQKILVVFCRLSSGRGLMVEFVIRVNQQRTAYIPKEVIEILGYEWLLVPNAKAAVVYPRQCDLRTAIRSVLVIVNGLKLMLSAREGSVENRDT